MLRDLGRAACDARSNRPEWKAHNGVAFSPDGALLAVCGQNNDVLLFSVPPSPAPPPPGAPDASAAAAAALSSAHSAAGGWAQAGRLCASGPTSHGTGHTGDVALMCFSPNGLYCATAGCDAQAVVWALRRTAGGAVDATPVRTARLPEQACGIAWRADAPPADDADDANAEEEEAADGGDDDEEKDGDKKSTKASSKKKQAVVPAEPSNAVAIFLHDGKVALWAAPVPSRLARPGCDATEAADEVEPERVHDDTDADDDAAAKGRRGGASALVDGAAEDGEEEAEESGDEGVDEGEAGGEGGEGGGAARRRGGGRTILRTVYVDKPAPVAQAPVQPGATPFPDPSSFESRHSHAAPPHPRRFLAYNLLGCITCRDDGDGGPGGGGGGGGIGGVGVQHIESHFHDVERGAGRAGAVTDHLGVTHGALGVAGVALASPFVPADAAEGTESRAAVLSFRPFSAWGGAGEWTLPLPVSPGGGAGDTPACLAVGATFLALATTSSVPPSSSSFSPISSPLLRIFSPSGLQCGLLCVDGPPVALAASGSFLAAAWHAAPPTASASAPMPHGEQRVAYAIYEVDVLTGGGAKVGSGGVALSPGATLTWLGFSDGSDHGRPQLATCDSAGIVRLRTDAFGGGWAPVWDARSALGTPAVAEQKSVAEEELGDERAAAHAQAAWVVGLAGAELFAVVVKAGCSHPPVAPRPVLSVFPLAPPLLSHTGETVAQLIGPGGGAAAAAADAPLEATLLRLRGAAAAEAAASSTPFRPGAPTEATLLAINKTLLKLLFGCLSGSTPRLGRAAEIADALPPGPALAGALQMASQFKQRALAERISAAITAAEAVEAAMGDPEAGAEYFFAQQQHSQQVHTQPRPVALHGLAPPGARFSRAKAPAAVVPPQEPRAAAPPPQQRAAPDARAPSFFDAPRSDIGGVSPGDENGTQPTVVAGGGGGKKREREAAAGAHPPIATTTTPAAKKPALATNPFARKA